MGAFQNVAERAVNDLPVLKNWETDKMFFRIVCWQGFSIEQLKSKRAKGPGAEFLPASVKKDGNVVWKFKTRHPEYAGLAKLTCFKGEQVILLCRGHLLDTVIPVSELPETDWLPDGFFSCPRGTKGLAKLKADIAETLGMKPWWNDAEITLRKATIEADQEKEARMRAERRDAFAKLRGEILERTSLVVYSTDGKQFEGTPVVGDEWKHLPNLWKCVHVRSYDSLARKASGIVSWFRVARKNGNLEISKEVGVSGIPSKKATATVHHISNGRALRDQRKRERSAADAARRLDMQGTKGQKSAKKAR